MAVQFTHYISHMFHIPLSTYNKYPHRGLYKNGHSCFTNLRSKLTTQMSTSERTDEPIITSYSTKQLLTAQRKRQPFYSTVWLNSKHRGRREKLRPINRWIARESACLIPNWPPTAFTLIQDGWLTSSSPNKRIFGSFSSRGISVLVSPTPHLPYPAVRWIYPTTKWILPRAIQGKKRRPSPAPLYGRHKSPDSTPSAPTLESMSLSAVSFFSFSMWTVCCDCNLLI